MNDFKEEYPGLDIVGVWFQPKTGSIGILNDTNFETFDNITNMKFEGEFWSHLQGWEFLCNANWIYIGEFE